MATLYADAKRDHDAVSFIDIPTARMCMSDSEAVPDLTGECSDTAPRASIESDHPAAASTYLPLTCIETTDLTKTAGWVALKGGRMRIDPSGVVVVEFVPNPDIFEHDSHVTYRFVPASAGGAVSVLVGAATKAPMLVSGQEQLAAQPLMTEDSEPENSEPGWLHYCLETAPRTLLLHYQYVSIALGMIRARLPRYVHRSERAVAKLSVPSASVTCADDGSVQGGAVLTVDFDDGYRLEWETEDRRIWLHRTSEGSRTKTQIYGGSIVLETLPEDQVQMIEHARHCLAMMTQQSTVGCSPHREAFSQHSRRMTPEDDSGAQSATHCGNGDGNASTMHEVAGQVYEGMSGHLLAVETARSILDPVYGLPLFPIRLQLVSDCQPAGGRCTFVELAGVYPSLHRSYGVRSMTGVGYSSHQMGWLLIFGTQTDGPPGQCSSHLCFSARHVLNLGWNVCFAPRLELAQLVPLGRHGSSGPPEAVIGELIKRLKLVPLFTNLLAANAQARLAAFDYDK